MFTPGLLAEFSGDELPEASRRSEPMVDELILDPTVESEMVEPTVDRCNVEPTSDDVSWLSEDCPIAGPARPVAPISNPDGPLCPIAIRQFGTKTSLHPSS